MDARSLGYGDDVSLLGYAFIVPEPALVDIQAAAAPRKRRFGGTIDEFWDVLNSKSTARLDYSWDGNVLATLLVYLQEQGIDLMHSDHDQASSELVNARSTTAFVLTESQQAAYGDRLDPKRFDEATLQRYFEEFTETPGDGVGVAMRDGVAFLRDTLTALTGGMVALLFIG